MKPMSHDDNELNEDTDAGELQGSRKAGPPHGDRRRRIAEAAYYRAERRGFSPGQEQADWIEAEMDVEAEDRAGGKLEDNEFPSPK